MQPNIQIAQDTLYMSRATESSSSDIQMTESAVVQLQPKKLSLLERRKRRFTVAKFGWKESTTESASVGFVTNPTNTISSRRDSNTISFASRASIDTATSTAILLAADSDWLLKESGDKRRKMSDSSISEECKSNGSELVTSHESTAVLSVITSTPFNCTSLQNEPDQVAEFSLAPKLFIPESRCHIPTIKPVKKNASFFSFTPAALYVKNKPLDE